LILIAATIARSRSSLLAFIKTPSHEARTSAIKTGEQ
jgi:hypothetical protein